jgi:hypothetical protein
MTSARNTAERPVAEDFFYGALPPDSEFSPRTDMHYALSEDDELALKTMHDAMIGLAQLGEILPDEIGPSVEVRHIGAIFRVFATHGAEIMSRAIKCRPKSAAVQ